jgi:hypothetical protein
MSAPNGEVAIQVRQAIAAARQAGQPAPGRPTLVRMTGATDHAVRKALAELAIQHDSAGEPGALLTSEAGVHSVAGQSADAAVGEPRAGTFVSTGDHGGGISPPTDRIATADDRPVTNPSTSVPPGGRLVAWTGFVFGSVMSIAANVLHAWLPAGHEPTGWSPGIAPQVGATVWPIGLMLAVEALSRIHWPGGFGWGVARFGGAGAVAVGSAIISYGHLRDVLLAWSYGPMGAAVGPLVLDGLMVVCGFALLANSRTNAGEAGGDQRRSHR